MRRNENLASTSPIRSDGRKGGRWAGQVKENICQTSGRLMAFLMAENQVCFYVTETGIGIGTAKAIGIDAGAVAGLGRGIASPLCGNLAADIKGRSCCKWLVLGRNERQPFAVRNRSSLLTLAKIR